MTGNLVQPVLVLALCFFMIVIFSFISALSWRIEGIELQRTSRSYKSLGRQNDFNLIILYTAGALRSIL